MPQPPYHTLDLHFLGCRGAIAAYFIPHPQGGVLIESGPGSTLPALRAGLAALGVSPQQISDVFLTHVHLDHAGAAGWLARQGAHIHIHPRGLAHMVDPTRLLSSASRLYGEQMDFLWGEFLPVPAERISAMQDGEVVKVHGLEIMALDTPGHADHHLCYLYADTCFSGDIGGVRLQGTRHLRLPTPPPEFHLEKWRLSLEALKRAPFTHIAPTHFGAFADRDWHLATLERSLDKLESWMEANLPTLNESDAALLAFSDWMKGLDAQAGLPEGLAEAYEMVSPTWMCAPGIQRYWRKYRSPEGQATAPAGPQPDGSEDTPSRTSSR